MNIRIRTLIVLAALASLTLSASTSAVAQEPWRVIYPEQQRMEIRDPTCMPIARLPRVPPPPTVSDPQWDAPTVDLSLDEAIRTALENSEIIRVLAGVTASSSGRSIYDPAITNTTIDQARARFDPSVDVGNYFNRRETPMAGFDPNDPTQVLFGGSATNDYQMSTGLAKSTVTGGSVGLTVDATPTRSNSSDLPLNPQTSSSVTMSLSQPLLQGAGARVNLAPVVLARIDTERSFFQLKDSVQRMVAGVIEAYWALVSARIDVWVRQQQFEQGAEALLVAENRLKVGTTDSAEVEQARSALANFRTTQIAAEANLLAREAALRNILGMPPYDGSRLVPVTPLNVEPLDVDWEQVVLMAEEYRPDLIELKLVLEADEQRLLVAQNTALPRVDVGALYRWNGLEGQTPDRAIISTESGQFTGWQLGVSFSVPLGMRQSRAGLRQQELIITRDRANLQQGLHNAVHLLAVGCRDIAQYYEQYQANRAASEAARVNLILQRANYGANRTIYLNVLQAITNWGSARSAEAQALAQYNSALMNIELQTGTLLESHGTLFFEERFGSIGPLGRLFADRCYPLDRRPGPNAELYPSTGEPAEKAFGLDPPTLGTPQGATSPETPTPAATDLDRLRIEFPEFTPSPVTE